MKVAKEYMPLKFVALPRSNNVVHMATELDPALGHLPWLVFEYFKAIETIFS